MKIRTKTLLEFQNNNIDVKIYLLLFLASTFCGNTWLLSFGTYLLFLVVLFQLCMSRVKGFTSAAFVNRTQIALPIILFLFSSFVLYQGLFSAFNKSITFNYAIRFYMYSCLLIFVPNYNIALLEIKIMKIYSLIAGMSGLLMTFITGHKSGGLLGDYQALGMMMSVSCVLYGVDYFLEEEKKNIIGYILSLLCIFVSGKRTFAFLALAAVIIAYIFTNKNQKNRRLFKFLFVGLLVVTLSYVFIPEVKELVNRFTLLSESGDEYTFTSGRTGMWDVAIEIFNNNKITGIGFANFGVYTGYYYTNGNTWAGLFLTHNIYYGLLCETGIIGTVLMLLFIIIALISTLKFLRRIRKHKNEISHLVYYSLLLQIWFIIYGFTGNGIYDNNEFLMYIFSVSIIFSCKKEWLRIKTKN